MPGRTRFSGAAATMLEVEIRPHGLVAVDGKTFPLKSALIRGRAEGGVAESHLVQTYANPYTEPLEVLYTLPLPADGAVVGYTITLGERVITGEVEPVEKARESYRKALEEGRTAGLLEQDRADTFTQSLGSLPAGVDAEIDIRIIHPLAFRPGTETGTNRWEYRFPTVVGVRYHGAGGRVPDSDRLDVDRADGFGTPVQVGLDLVLADDSPGALQPSSASHDILIDSDEDGSRVRLDDSARLDRDVVIEWRAAEERIGVRLACGPGLPGDEGRYGLLTITPPERPDATFDRDLTILMDASGSMGGWPMDCCKKLVEELIDSLEPTDRFELLAFSTSVLSLSGGTVKATGRKVKQAKKQLAALQAGGATEMAHALEEALRPLRPDSQRQVILLTDGYIGFESEVIGKVLRGLEPGCRVHAIGVGAAPNRTLTRGVARAGGGAELFVEDPDTTASAAEDLLKATVGPVLTDLSVTGSACRQIAPSKPRDIMAGQPLVLTVDLQTYRSMIEVSGRVPGSSEPWVRELTVPGLEEKDAGGRSPLPLGALFGREAVEDLEMRRATSPEMSASKIDAQIEDVGMRHRITTRQTSLVAVADEPTVDPSEPRRRRRLEVELPAGVSAEGVGLARYLPAFASRRTLGEGVFDLMPASMVGSGDWVAEDRSRETLDRFATLHRKTRTLVLEIEGPLLVIEFESPCDGFLLPSKEDSITVVIGGVTREAKIVEKRSTRQGPHERGLTLRLALRLEESEPWPGGTALLSWNPEGGDPQSLTVILG